MNLLPRGPGSGTSKPSRLRGILGLVFFLGCEQAFSLWKNAAMLPSTSPLCKQSKVKPGHPALKQLLFQKAGGGLLGDLKAAGGCERCRAICLLTLRRGDAGCEHRAGWKRASCNQETYCGCLTSCAMHNLGDKMQKSARLSGDSGVDLGECRRGDAVPVIARCGGRLTGDGEQLEEERSWLILVVADGLQLRLVMLAHGTLLPAAFWCWDVQHFPRLFPGGAPPAAASGMLQRDE